MSNDVIVLSEREQEILRLLATGASNKEIAQFLHISTNTVKVHLRNIYSKIGVSSRTEAAMRAVKDGLYDIQIEAIDKPAVSQLTDAIPSNINDAKPKLSWFVFGLLVLILALFGGFYQWQKSVQVMGETESAVEGAQFSGTPQWKTLAPLLTPRSHMATAEIGNVLYVIGGHTDSGITGSVESYNIDDNSWANKSEKPTPVSEISAVLLGGKIYIPGGRLSSSSVTDVLEIYDPISNSWVTGAPVPQPVSAYGLAVFEGRMFLFGGWDGQLFINQSYVYDPELDRWQQINPMPTARGYLGTAVSGRKIFVVGGFDGEEYLAVTEIYQPDLVSSSQPPWSQGPSLPEANSAMGTVSIAEMVYLLGGKSSGNRQYSTLVLEEQSDEWKVFEEPIVELGEGLGVTKQGMNIFVIGGIVNGQYQMASQVYQAVYTISLPIISRSTK